MISVIDTCCDKPSDLPVYPPRVFEHIPDEIPFARDLPTIDNEMYPPSVDQQTKPVLRNRLILLGAMLVFVVYFQTYTSKKRS